MTTWYIDGSGGNDSTGNGSIGTPYKTPTKLATVIVNGDTALFKRDSSLLVTGRANFNSLSNITIGDYGSGALHQFSSYTQFAATEWDGVTPADPITAMQQWYEVDPTDGVTAQAGSHLWRINLTAFWTPVRFLNFGILGNYGTHMTFWDAESEVSDVVIRPENVPASDKQFDVRNGANAADPSCLIVWAPENPVTYYGSLYYQTGQQPVMRFSGCDALTLENLSLRYGDMIAAIDNSAASGGTHSVAGLTATECFGIVSLTGGAEGSGNWINGFSVSGCTATNIYGDAILPTDSIQDGVIELNTVSGSGLVNSSGAVYLGNCFAPEGHEIHIRRNIIDDQKFGRHWLHDGRGVMTDSNCQNVWVYRNLVTNSHQAFGSNAGRAGNRWFSNITVNCDQGYVESDTAVIDLADTQVYNNAFLNCGINVHYQDDSQDKDNGAVRFGTSKVGAAARYYVKNNIITGAGTASVAQGVALQPAGADAGVVVDSHNAINGFAVQKGAWGVSLATGAGTLAVAPGIVYFNGVPRGFGSVALLHSGVETGNKSPTYGGTAFRSPPSIGPFEPAAMRSWL